AWAVRVHDPASSALACRVAGAIADHSGSAPSPWTQR
ncbi:dihydropteroate synthase, partial [Burkholderia multivorans]